MSAPSANAPSARQIAYAERLGVWQAGLSSAQLSDTIENARQQLDEQAERARRVDILTLVDTHGLRRVGREWAGPCPFCGTGRDRFHLVPRLNRWLCRTCTEGRYQDPIALVMRREGCGYYEAVRLLVGDPLVPLVPPAPSDPTPAPWQAPWWSTRAARLMTRWLAPQRFDAWQGYKPLARATIEARALGLGRVPACPCPHLRLLVPVWEGGELVAVRGRALACSCAKWMTAGGSRKALYGLETLQTNSVVWVVENHIDGLLLEERYEGWQTLSPTTGAATRWPAEWIARVAAARPAQVVVAMDNDPTGRAASHRIATALHQADIPTRLWDWADAPEKADIGWLLTQRKQVA